MKRIFLTGIIFGLVTFAVRAQDNEFHMPAPSPTVTVNQQFSTSFIKLNYSRPGVKDRKIFGDLIPYGDIWRTGANSATEVTFGEDVELDGHKIEKGDYALYTKPGEKEWEIIFNQGTSNWGSEGFDKEDNVLKFSVPVTYREENQESLRISIENLRKDSADLVISWEKSKVVIPIKAPNDERILSHLEKELKSENPPYFSAASYYLSTDQNIDDALNYVNKAIDENPDTYYMYWTRAEILEKLDEHDKALKSAKKAAKLAKDHGSEFEYEYQKKYDDLKNKK